MGVRPPSNVTNVTLAETSNPGEVTMTWSPVTTNIDGTTIDSNMVTYNVYDAHENPLMTEMSETSYTFQAMDYDNEPQKFARYYVNSHFSSFFSAQAAFSPYLLIGKPYQLPFHETTTTGAMRYAWLFSGDIAWDVSGEDGDLRSVDGDGTFYFVAGSAENQQGTMTSGRILISGDEPKLSLAYATLLNNTNTLAVKVICDGTTTTLGTITLTGSSSNYEWKTVEYDLSAYDGKMIQLEFTGTVISHTAVLMDNIQVTSIGSNLVRGDLNGDGNVDVTDVSLLIDVVLGKEVTLADGAVTDLNDDGNVDVTDVSLLIDIVLGKAE